MSKQPEALRLAGALYEDDEVPSLEYCRLAALSEALRAALAQPQAIKEKK